MAERRRFDVVQPHGGAAAPPVLRGDDEGRPGRQRLSPAPPWGLVREPGRPRGAQAR